MIFSFRRRRATIRFNMIFSFRRRRASRAGNDEGNSDLELTIPSHFRCPISLDLMKDPVTLSTGITYDRESIERWIEAGNGTCPVTNQVLSHFDQIPNHAIRKMIQDWCVENRSHGIERIPTPRIPVSSYDVSQICSRIMAATQRGDDKKCRELVGKIKNWAKESDRNKKCIAENGAGCYLSESFETFSSISIQKHEGLLEDILSALTWVFPLGQEGLSKLGSTPSLRCMVWFLKSEDLSTRQNAVLALKELLSQDERPVNGLIEIEGVAEALFKIVKVPICPTATKASLMVIYYLVSSKATSDDQKITSQFVELGLVSLILEILVDAEKSICEKSLGVLNGICSSNEGREKAHSHALTIPVLVKKLLRVSEMATEFSVSILWKLCKGDNEGHLLVEALQVGAFQKVLVVLQVGCGEKTKGKATELLKMMNQYKDRSDCFDLDFMYVKRPY
ncbi:unnamed protein product [Ilex paraguariensis]|uniref:U-box domain-containing protein n=1 Tax=Ilex paraguariensis TaxID=185542 RepID=A0ABC8TXU8_9AQUA